MQSKLTLRLAKFYASEALICPTFGREAKDIRLECSDPMLW